MLKHVITVVPLLSASVLSPGASDQVLITNVGGPSQRQKWAALNLTSELEQITLETLHIIGRAG